MKNGPEAVSQINPSRNARREASRVRGAPPEVRKPIRLGWTSKKNARPENPEDWNRFRCERMNFRRCVGGMRDLPNEKKK